MDERLGRLDPHKDHMKLREIHQRFAGLPTPFIGPRLPQSPRRRSRTRHKPEKKKTLHWPVSPLPRPAPQPPGPPPIPEGTDDDDWTDDDDEHHEDPDPYPGLGTQFGKTTSRPVATTTTFAATPTASNTSN